MRQPCRVFGIILFSLLALPLLAQDALSPAEARLRDATSYAQQVGVSVDEALRRLSLQQVAGDLEARLSAEESGTFAGLYIDDTQQYRIVVRSTDRNAGERVRARVAGGPLEGLVEVRPARFSLADLEKKQKETRGQVVRAGVQHSSDINVFENRVEVYVTDPEALSAKLAAARARLPEGVEVQRVPSLDQPHNTEIYGGVALTSCTSGWNVRAGSGELGTTTAMHCRRLAGEQYYQGVLLPFRAGKEGGDQDIQWMSTCDLFVTRNVFDSGAGLRYVTGTVPRSNQVVGQYLCKNGKNLGYRCGWIQSKSYDWNPGWGSFNATFIRVDSRSSTYKLSGPGDSGGPWFVEDKAYGTTLGTPGSDPNDAIYMAINYISAIGVSVLTYDPGECSLPPNAHFFWDRPQPYDFYVTFDASYSSDPDGYIVSYYWDFGDGYTTTTTTPYVDWWYQYAGTYGVTLIVTDNEGKTGSYQTLVTVCDESDICLQ